VLSPRDEFGEKNQRVTVLEGTPHVFGRNAGGRHRRRASQESCQSKRSTAIPRVLPRYTKGIADRDAATVAIMRPPGLSWPRL